LSYTDFEYVDPKITIENDTINVVVTIKNIKNMIGKEVVQVYVSKPNSGIDRPVQELKAFKKTKALLPNEFQTIVFQIPVSELSYWNEDKSSWTLERGVYSIRLGASSRDIRVAMEVEL